MIEKHSHGDLIYFWQRAEEFAKQYNFTLHWYYTKESIGLVIRGLSVHKGDKKVGVFDTIYDLLSFLEGYHLCKKEEKGNSDK